MKNKRRVRDINEEKSVPSLNPFCNCSKTTGINLSLMKSPYIKEGAEHVFPQCSRDSAFIEFPSLSQSPL